MTTTITRADRDRFVEIMSSEESKANPEPPVELFTVDNIRFRLHPVATSSLEQVLLLLGARFNYRSDDAPHDAVYRPP